jgi:hypothetical protein
LLIAWLAFAALTAVIAIAFFITIPALAVPITALTAFAAGFGAVTLFAGLLLIPFLGLRHIRAENQRIFQCLWWELVPTIAAAPIAATHDGRSQVQTQIVLGKLQMRFSLHVVSRCCGFARQSRILVVDLMCVAADANVRAVRIKNLVPCWNRTLLLLLWLTPTAVVVALPHVVSFALRRKWY